MVAPASRRWLSACTHAAQNRQRDASATQTPLPIAICSIANARGYLVFQSDILHTGGLIRRAIFFTYCLLVQQAHKP
jgi:hypothetical protein